MTKDDADRAISAGVPGVYSFVVEQYDTVSEFLREFRRYEAICRSKGYNFTPSLNGADDPPFNAFDITIDPTGVAMPFVAHSRKDVSRKLTRL